MTPVTMVIPTRAPSPYLDEAVASVAVDGAEVEVIVVEDGTRDVDAKTLSRLIPTLRVLALPHVGRSEARNAGVRAAETELVAFLDADDVSLPGRLARQAAALTRSAAGLAFGRVESIDEASRPLPAESEIERRRFDRLLARGAGLESLLVDCPIYTSATMVRRDAFLELGGYRVELDAYEDLDLYLRMTETFGLVPCDGEPVALHRLHPGNTPSDSLFAGSVRLAQLHLRDGVRRPRALRLLREREIDGLWSLGDFSSARRLARRALAQDPGIVSLPRFRRRLLAYALPVAVLRAIRAART